MINPSLAPIPPGVIKIKYPITQEIEKTLIIQNKFEMSKIVIEEIK